MSEHTEEEVTNPIIRKIKVEIVEESEQETDNMTSFACPETSFNDLKPRETGFNVAKDPKVDNELYMDYHACVPYIKVEIEEDKVKQEEEESISSIEQPSILTESSNEVNKMEDNAFTLKRKAPNKMEQHEERISSHHMDLYKHSILSNALLNIKKKRKRVCNKDVNNPFAREYKGLTEYLFEKSQTIADERVSNDADCTVNINEFSKNNLVIAKNGKKCNRITSLNDFWDAKGSKMKLTQGVLESKLKVPTKKKSSQLDILSPAVIAKCSKNLDKQLHMATHTNKRPFPCNPFESKKSSPLDISSNEVIAECSTNLDNKQLHMAIQKNKKPCASKTLERKKSTKLDISSPQVIAKYSTNLDDKQLPMPYVTQIQTDERPSTGNVSINKSLSMEVYGYFMDHMRQQTGKKPCKQAGDVLKNDINMTHTGTEEKPFACPLCDYRCKLKAQLNIHSRAHNVEQQFACPICDYKSIRKCDLKNHIIVHTGEKPFACNLCDYRCNQKKHLTVHSRIHSDEKPFECNICDYKSRNKVHLKYHMRNHTGEKQYACHICDYKCNQKCNLKTHLAIHTDEKPFACTFCDYKCKQKSSFNNHVRRHTGEKPFACHVCEYKCIRRNDLNNHIRKHTGDKPFQCDTCERKFILKWDLNKHMKTHKPKI